MHCRDLHNKSTPICPEIVLGLGRCHPLEQMSPTDEKAKQRAHHRIDHEPCLMREERDQERALHQAESKIAAQSSANDCAAKRLRGAEQCLQSPEAAAEARSSEGYTRSKSRRPRSAGTRRSACARKAAGAESERRRLSSSFQRPINGIALLRDSVAILETKAENPGQQLPIAPHPAMLARRRRRRNATETPRPPRCPRPGPRARRCLPADRG